MKFEHQLAGNAVEQARNFLGRKPFTSAMVRAITSTVLTVLLLPAGAHAADPLLSGYGGPGGGEQVVLGSKLIDPPKGGGGASGRLRATAPPVAAQPAPATRTTPRPSGNSGTSRGTKHARAHQGSGSNRKTAAPKAAPAATPGAPPVRAYPSRASDIGGLPLSGGDVLLGLIALFVVGVVSVALRQVADTGPARSGPAQAGSR
jgi:hypothetical protein